MKWWGNKAQLETEKKKKKTACGMDYARQMPCFQCSSTRKITITIAVKTKNKINVHKNSWKSYEIDKNEDWSIVGWIFMKLISHKWK